jgi:hypothetical protein
MKFETSIGEQARFEANYGKLDDSMLDTESDDDEFLRVFTVITPTTSFPSGISETDRSYTNDQDTEDGAPQLLP